MMKNARFTDERRRGAEPPTAFDRTEDGLAERDQETILLTLWEQAWRLAQRWCAGSLRRLRAGDGGFYEVDDLQQDLFIEFWGLVRQWRRDGTDEAALWTAWRRRLWGQGCHILRRRPQRLWARAERPVAPERLALETADEPIATGASLPPAARRALTEPEDAAVAQEEMVDLDRLEIALWALPPTQRQVLYMLTLAGIRTEAATRFLGLSNRTAVYQRLFAARRALRRRLDSHPEEEHS